LEGGELPDIAVTGKGIFTVLSRTKRTAECADSATNDFCLCLTWEAIPE